MDDLLAVVANNNMLCLNVDEPSWDNARGYLFDAKSRTLYFPVDKKGRQGRNLDRYEVLSLGSVRHHDLSGHVFVASSAKNAAVKVKCSDLIRNESDPCYFSGLDLGLKFQVGDRKAMNAIERGKLEYNGHIELHRNHAWRVLKLFCGDFDHLLIGSRRWTLSRCESLEGPE